MDFDFIEKILKEHQLTLASRVLPNPTRENSVYVPLESRRSETGRRVPSHRTLAQVREALAAGDINAEFLMVDPSSRMLEEGVRASLISSFPRFVRNAFLSVEAGTAHVWIDAKTIIGDELESIRDHISKYFGLFGIDRSLVHIMGEHELATNTEILSIIRRLAPIDCDELRQQLINRNFPVPSLDWINRKFDTLRRTGLVVRRKDRTYTLTAEALHRLGTRKDRFSPDVGRLLALARRDG